MLARTRHSTCRGVSIIKPTSDRWRSCPSTWVSSVSAGQRSSSNRSGAQARAVVGVNPGNDLAARQ